MAAKLFTRFTRVKTVKSFTIGPIESAINGKLKFVEFDLPIYLDSSGDGSFVVPIPEHVARFTGEYASTSEYDRDAKHKIEQDEKTGTYYIACTPSVEKIKTLYRAILNEYQRKVQHNAAKRVICIGVWAHKPRNGEERAITLQTHELFRVTPETYAMIRFSYDVLWQVGDDLYEQDSPDQPMQYVGMDRRHRYNLRLPWSAELEASCAKFEQDLRILSARMADFFNQDHDALIANLSGASNLLPGPSTEPAPRVRRARK